LVVCMSEGDEISPHRLNNYDKNSELLRDIREL
jgi:hypothetical protein